jgi:hypothetical protein
MEDSVSWANAKLNEAQYRSQGLQRALADRRLGEPGSALRASFIEQCLTELRAIEIDVFAVEEVVGANSEITGALRAIANDRARIELFAGNTDPPGARPEMTWAQAFRQVEIARLAQTLIDEITEQVNPAAENPLSTLFRSDGPYRAAQEFAQDELSDRIAALMTVATRFADHARDELMEDRYPGFEYRTEDPPPEFHIMVRELIQQLAPVLFPMDGSYVTGDLFNLLVAVYAYVNRAIGGDLANAAIRLMLVDLLFLRGQLPALASYGASLGRGTVACEALVRTAAILMTAANRSGPGKIPSGYQMELDALQFYVDAFMTSMLGRLATAASTAEGAT